MSAIVSYSFKAPKPRDTCGQITPSGSDIPTFRGRRFVRLKQLIKELDGAQEDLSETPCSFWACNGPRRPKPMCMCCKCAAMRTIGKVRAALAQALAHGKDLRQQYSR